MAQRDLLYPLKKDNRPEHFLIEYEGFIRNLAEAVIISMRGNLDENLTNFPGLSQYIELPRFDLYNATCLYTPEEIVSRISYPEISIEDIWAITDAALAVNVIEQQAPTMFEYALTRISREEFCQSITFIKRRPFLDFEIEYTSLLFKDSIRKINFVSGDIVEAVHDDSPYTSIAMHDTDEVLRILDKLPPEKAKNIFFIVLDTIHNCKFTPGGNIEYVGDEKLSNHKTNKEITRMFPECILENVPSTGIL